MLIFFFINEKHMEIIKKNKRLICMLNFGPGFKVTQGCFSSLSHAQTLLLKPHPVRTAGSWEVEPLLPIIAESALSRILKHFLVLLICPDSPSHQNGFRALLSSLESTVWSWQKNSEYYFNPQILITFNFAPIFFPGGNWTHPSCPSNQSHPPSHQFYSAGSL